MDGSGSGKIYSSATSHSQQQEAIKALVELKQNMKLKRRRHKKLSTSDDKHTDDLHKSEAET